MNVSALHAPYSSRRRQSDDGPSTLLPARASTRLRSVPPAQRVYVPMRAPAIPRRIARRVGLSVRGERFEGFFLKSKQDRARFSFSTRNAVHRVKWSIDLLGVEGAWNIEAVILCFRFFKRVYSLVGTSDINEGTWENGMMKKGDYV